LPFHETEIIHRVKDGNVDLEFRWARPTRAVLEQLDLKPAPLHALFEAMPVDVQHVVRRDVAG